MLTNILSQALELDLYLVYYDKSDISWAAEDAVIQKGQKIFAGDNNSPSSTAPAEIRNQARVHIWYQENRGIDCPQHESSEAAIATFPTTTASLGVRLLPNGDWPETPVGNSQMEPDSVLTSTIYIAPPLRSWRLSLMPDTTSISCEYPALLTRC
ncbi:hypothetical protein BJY01DRAFT_230385 [Aspergillus pseudoustus]|uniref:Uncharacterized protein n=1 Tax=Aspergillus pseudoustus TaxID=1810923 RepID=A0ABR4IAS5_9EURO